jgi:hypothetical protein
MINVDKILMFPLLRIFFLMSRNPWPCLINAFGRDFLLFVFCYCSKKVQMTIKSKKYKCMLQSKTTEKAAPNDTSSPFSKNAPARDKCICPLQGHFWKGAAFQLFFTKAGIYFSEFTVLRTLLEQ